MLELCFERYFYSAAFQNSCILVVLHVSDKSWNPQMRFSLSKKKKIIWLFSWLASANFKWNKSKCLKVTLFYCCPLRQEEVFWLLEWLNKSNYSVCKETETSFIHLIPWNFHVSRNCFPPALLPGWIPWKDTFEGSPRDSLFCILCTVSRASLYDVILWSYMMAAN